MEKEGSSCSRLLAAVLAGFAMLMLSSFLTFFIVKNYYPEQICGLPHYTNQPLHFSEQPQWDATERIEIEEKGVTVVRTYNSDRCYVMPMHTEGEKKVLSLVHTPLSRSMLEDLAGPDSVKFCSGADAYLLKDVHSEELMREKRQAATAAPVAAADRPSGLDIPYEQRTPRCMDLILDCGVSVGQVQNCYTWINGVILMAQECVSETEFKIYMTKPPGRILKIAQQQWKECLLRRQQGLRC